MQACNDAHIGLSTTPEAVDEKTYEIVIGGWENKRSAIRDAPQVRDVAYMVG